jgi:cytochrome c-type biogenesis protein CcmE
MSHAIPRRAPMTRKQRRLTIIAASGLVLALAAGLILFAMRDRIVFFHGPTDVVEKSVQPGQRFRLGGLVREGSVTRQGQTVTFEVTDGRTHIPVSYTGILPDLFREGQGVVTEGALQPGGLFKADSVLARHDENYMPREVADALKKQGHWQNGAAKPGAASGGPSAAQPARPPQS